ncbi:tyrosine-type recombinase/integrase [Rubricoccus marinus]|uniref:Integrase n=1 Tax=Rubricoccus marinus TaxID=716817 RepID=A0A259TUW1_9BACT|nr:tyrosine-type recombinase/integrase [Rubricoccus marinus]OZC01364.1 hypothetical protein BSZ36_18160 [Rubricoccus marinus]
MRSTPQKGLLISPSDATARLAAPDPGSSASVEMSLAEAIELFIGRTLHTKSGSRHTESAYRSDLKHFGRFLANDRLRVGTVGRRDAERYLTRLSTKLAARTVARRIYCVRSFYRFLRGIDVVTTNPFDALDLPGFNRKSETHKVLAEDELERAVARLSDDMVEANRQLEASEPGGDRQRAFAALFTAARRRATFTLMAFAGLRREEVLTLPREAIVPRPDGYYLSFTGKGDKRRTVPLVGFAYPAMTDWLAVRRYVPNVADEVFITLAGQAVDPKQIQRDCARLQRHVKTRHKLTPHVLRRTFGTRTLRYTGDLRGTQELLGHASIQTTEVYTHVDEESLRRLMETNTVGAAEHARGAVLAHHVPV